LTALPAFDAMGVASLVQRQKGLFDVWVDPRFFPVVLHFGTQRDDLSKGGIGRNNKAVLPDGLGQGARKYELVQGQNSAGFGFDPKSLGVITRISHREHPVGVRMHQQIEIEQKSNPFQSTAITNCTRRCNGL
jgi:hypothetical protein